MLLATTMAACGATSAAGGHGPGATTSSTTTTPVPSSTPTDGPLSGPGAQSSYVVEAQPPPGSCHYRSIGPDPLPDPTCTPGALDPAVTQADIGSTICSYGYAARVRPPEDVTEREKRASALSYGYTGAFATAEYDHLVPLELGGDPNDPANLWVEPNDLAGATSFHNSKDDVEDALNRLVCSGRLALRTAQDAIAADWVTAGRRYGA